MFLTMKTLANLMSLKWRSLKGTSATVGRYNQKKNRSHDPMTVCVCVCVRVRGQGFRGERREVEGKGESVL